MTVTIQNVVNKGEYGGKRDVVVTNLDLTRVFLKWKQYEEDVPSFAKAVKQKYESRGQCRKHAVRGEYDASNHV